MTYRIPLKKLRKLADPYYQNCFGEYIMSEDLVTQAMLNQNIFEDKTQSEFQNHIRKIAYLASNYSETEVLEINLEENSDGWIVTKGIHQLAAAIIQKEEYVLADVSGSKSRIQKVFGELTQVEVENPESTQTIDWSTISTPDLWTNVENVLPKLKYAVMHKLAVEQVVKNIPDELWFHHGAQLVGCFYNMPVVPQHILDSKEFLMNIKDSSVAFGNIWKHYYQHTQLSVELGELIKKEVFDNPDICWGLLAYNYNTKNIHEQFSQRVRLEPRIVEMFYEQHAKEPKSISLREVLPARYFEDLDNVKTFLKKNKNFDKLYNQDFSYVYKSWIDNKDFLRQCINENLPVKEFADFIPKSFFQDKDFLMEYIKHDKKHIHSMSKKDFMDKDVLSLCVDVGGSSMIAFSVLFKVKDKEIIKKIIKDCYRIMMDIHTPKEWLNDIELVSSIPVESIHWGNQQLKNKFFSVEENCILSLQSSTGNTRYFPLYMLKKESIALEYLRHARDTKEVYPSLWSGKDFCLKAIEANIFSMQCVPVEFFNEKKFVLDFARKIDNNAIDKSAILHTPMRKLIEEQNIESNYHAFFNTFFMADKLEKDLAQTRFIKSRKI